MSNKIFEINSKQNQNSKPIGKTTRPVVSSLHNPNSPNKGGSPDKKPTK